ncbi:MAG TPA: hypothetical protein VMJ12_07410 [Candidatus Acidoferrales bacterium]|nr:hypothetical protein [Candidatus Acidoferrales bacterium]
MKKKRLTLKELRLRWWWKRKEIRRHGVQGVDWDSAEEAARNYELMRRTFGVKRFPRTFLQLDRNEKALVHTLWAMWPQLPRREATRREQYHEWGWSPFHETEHRQWNLRLADKTLIDEFIREIRTLRKIQHTRPQHPLTGQINRLSRGYIELLDRKRYGNGKFNDSERHVLSVARKRAKQYYTQNKHALAGQWKGQDTALDSYARADTERFGS